jgi:hypothetical protein
MNNRNIYIFPTNQSSIILFDRESKEYLPVQKEAVRMEHQHLIENREIYITSEEYISNGYVTNGEEIFEVSDFPEYSSEYANRYWQKIFATSDKRLIEKGVNQIRCNFLKWYLKNTKYDFIELIAYCSWGTMHGRSTTSNSSNLSGIPNSKNVLSEEKERGFFDNEE